MEKDQSPPIHITQKASSYINSLLTNKKPKTTVLCIKVVAGGCSGLSYQLSFVDNEPNNLQDQYLFSTQGFMVMIDKRSYFYIVDSILDYGDGFDGKGLYFTNPKAARNCSCGSSFSL